MNNEQHEWYWKGYNDAKKSLAQPAVGSEHIASHGEPVAFKCGDAIVHIKPPVYGATPPQRTWVGLTDDEMTECIVSICNTDDGTGDTRDLIRAVEAKLKEKNTK